jgi:hypothetical protein
VSYKKQELLFLHEHLGSPPVFGGGPCCSSFKLSVLCFCALVVFILCPMLPVSLDCPFLIVPSFILIWQQKLNDDKSSDGLCQGELNIKQIYVEMSCYMYFIVNFIIFLTPINQSNRLIMFQINVCFITVFITSQWLLISLGKYFLKYQ